MQAAVPWFVIAVLAVAAGVALLRQVRLLAAARERERLLDRQLAHSCGFALAGQLGGPCAQQVRDALDAVLARAGAAQVFAAAGAARELQHAFTELCAHALVARDETRQLLTLLHPRATGREGFDLNEMAADAVRLCDAQARRRGMELILQPAYSCARVVGERAQLALALLQLLTNALDAMEQTAAPHRRVLVSTHDDGGRAEVRVSDRGHGFGGRRPDALFAPYFTTRTGRAGLGLALARRIVEAHDGQLGARRRAGGGAIFTLSLPARPAEPAAVLPDAAAARPSSFASSCAVLP